MTVDILAIDVETTGYSPKTDRIIQIGGVAVRIEDDQFRVTGVLDLVVNPGMNVPVSREIEHLTGLSRERLNSGMPMYGAWDKLQEFLNIPTRSSDSERVELVGHNIHFDLRMIGAEATRLRRVTNIPGVVYCTMKSHKRPIKLADLCRQLEVPVVGGFHNAFNDAVSTMLCHRTTGLPWFAGKAPATFIGYDVSKWGIWSCVDTNPELVGMILRNRGLVTVESAF